MLNITTNANQDLIRITGTNHSSRTSQAVQHALVQILKENEHRHHQFRTVSPDIDHPDYHRLGFVSPDLTTDAFHALASRLLGVDLTDFSGMYHGCGVWTWVDDLPVGGLTIGERIKLYADHDLEPLFDINVLIIDKLDLLLQKNQLTPGTYSGLVHQLKDRVELLVITDSLIEISDQINLSDQINHRLGLTNPLKPIEPPIDLTSSEG